MKEPKTVKINQENLMTTNRKIKCRLDVKRNLRMPKVARDDGSENLSDSLQYLVSCLDPENCKEFKNLVKQAKEELSDEFRPPGIPHQYLSNDT